MNIIKIGLLAYKESSIVAKMVVENLSDPSLKVSIIEGVMEEILEHVKAARDKGIEVFLAGGANFDTVVKNTDVPVIKLQVTTFEYLKTLRIAKEMGGKVVLPYHKHPVFVDIETLRVLTGLEIIPLEFENPADLRDKLSNTPADIVVGGTIAYEIASMLNIKALLVTPSEEAVMNALKDAKHLALALRKEREKAKTTEAIIQYTLNGVIATNEKGVVTLFNPAAANILSIKASQILGLPLEQVIPELQIKDILQNNQPVIGEIVTLQKTEIIINKVPLTDYMKNTGCILIFQNVTDVIKAEQRIRTQNKQKGLVAKAHFTDIIGKSEVIRREIEKAKMYTKTDSNILIYGETGVGKELFAQSIHNHSLRQAGPFIAINCAAIPENLLESELFGYEEGAFTGSRKGGKMGLFELAHRGTIFLDEVGEIPPNVQARLLRVLQEKEVMRVGGDSVIPIDVRIITATNRKLEEDLPQTFREDLYYRLNVLFLNIPPLRQRDNDIIDIFSHFLSLSINQDDYSPFINASSLSVLKKYSWPGNIRELFNVSERFVVQLKNTLRVNESSIHELLIASIGQDKLFDDICKQFSKNGFENSKEKKQLKQLITVLENVFPGKKSYIAKKLGLSRTTLWRKSK